MRFRASESAQHRRYNRLPFIKSTTAKVLIVRNALLCAAGILITCCGTATFTRTGSDATIEGLRNFELAFIDEFAVPGKKKFNAAAGNAKFQQAIADEKFILRHAF